MSKDKFLKTLQYFDDNFNVITVKDNDTFRKLDNDKDAVKKHKHWNIYNHIDIVRVKRIIQTDNNCFVPFYDLEEKLLLMFFHVLSDTEVGVLYFDDYADKYRDKKTENRDNALQNKIDAVLAYAVDVGEDTSAFTTKLEYLRNTLNNKHFTKRQLFQNLLLHIAYLTNNGKQGNTVSNVTNKLIKDYFDCDISFTRKENITKYQSQTYVYYCSKGITLYHS